MFYCNRQPLEGNARLKREWHDLLTRVRPDHRLFGSDWYEIWNRTVGRRAPWSGELQIVCVYDDVDGDLYGVLPIGHPNVGKMRFNTMVGPAFPSRVLLAASGQEFQVGRSVGWFLLELGWDIIELGPWSMSHEAHCGVLSAVNELQLPVTRRTSNRLAAANLPATWQQFQDDAFGRLKSLQIALNLNRLQQRHRVEIRHVRAPSECELTTLLEDLARLELRLPIHLQSPTPRRFQHAADRCFWKELIRDWLIPQGFFDCWLMLLDGQPNHVVLTLTSGTTRHVIVNCFDEQSAEAGTDAILSFDMFQEGYTRGVTRYEFGTSETDCELEWGAGDLDRIDSYSVATNSIINGCWQAGVKLKQLLYGSDSKHSPMRTYSASFRG